MRLVVQRCGFFGLPTDTMKFRGNVLAEDFVIGEQWAPPGSKAHCDGFTIYDAWADITIRRGLIKRLLSGQPAGVNNALRVVANKNTDPVATANVNVEDLVIYTDATASYIMQVALKRNFRPAVRLRRVGIRGLKASPAMLLKLAYPGSRFKEWDVWDLDGGGPIPVPPNVTVG
jgi:hypothetical protein